jgi:hypothetical protein
VQIAIRIPPTAAAQGQPVSRSQAPEGAKLFDAHAALHRRSPWLLSLKGLEPWRYCTAPEKNMGRGPRRAWSISTARLTCRAKADPSATGCPAPGRRLVAGGAGVGIWPVHGRAE